MNVLQDWVSSISFMQQTVLLTAVRGPDGISKYHPAKFLLRWFRRCILLSALDKKILKTPCEWGGGSFTGASFPAPPDQTDWVDEMEDVVVKYMKSLDEIPHHFQMHFMHAAEILGYKHPDSVIREWWLTLYKRLVHDMHLWEESETQLDKRLGDSRGGWLERCDKATVE